MNLPYLKGDLGSPVESEAEAHGVWEGWCSVYKGGIAPQMPNNGVTDSIPSLWNTADHLGGEIYVCSRSMAATTWTSPNLSAFKRTTSSQIVRKPAYLDTEDERLGPTARLTNTPVPHSNLRKICAGEFNIIGLLAGS